MTPVSFSSSSVACDHTRVAWSGFDFNTHQFRGTPQIRRGQKRRTMAVCLRSWAFCSAFVLSARKMVLLFRICLPQWRTRGIFLASAQATSAHAFNLRCIAPQNPGLVANPSGAGSSDLITSRQNGDVSSSTQCRSCVLDDLSLLGCDTLLNPTPVLNIPSPIQNPTRFTGLFSVRRTPKTAIRPAFQD